MKRVFVNPDNNFEYFEVDGKYMTNNDRIREFFLPNRFIPDCIGIRSLEYCEKYYIEITNKK